MGRFPGENAGGGENFFQSVVFATFGDPIIYDVDRIEVNFVRDLRDGDDDFDLFDQVFLNNFNSVLIHM